MMDKQRFIILSKEDPSSIELANHVRQRFEMNHWVFDEIQPQLVVTIGGDGTFLRAIHRFMDRIEDVQFIGIHTGTLGFFTNYNPDELDEFFNDIQSNRLRVHLLPILGVEVKHRNENYHFDAVNEIRVENVIRTQLLKVSINGHLLETFRGTGFCISTQAGSTAYNRSLGGAILQEGLDFMQLTEITGIHHHAYRSLGSPLIVKQESIVQLTSDDFNNAILCYDHLSFPLEKDTVLTVHYMPKHVCLLVRPEYTYFHRLKSLF